MGKAKDPDFTTGLRGRNRTRSLLEAYARGAVIVTDDTKEPVTYDKKYSFRRWVSLEDENVRYDSYEVHPEFEDAPRCSGFPGGSQQDTETA